MATREEMLVEADRRGLLTGERKAAFDEAVRRGIIQGPNNPPIQARSRTALEEGARQLVGLPARYATEGALALPGLLADVPAAAANGILELADLAAQKSGIGRISYRFPEQNQLVSETLTRLGLPVPETRLEEAVGTASRAVAGAAGGIGAGSVAAGSGNATTAAVGDILATQPTIQGVSAVTGAIGSETAKEMGFGPAGQFVGGMVGAMTPTGAVPALNAAKRAVGGGEAGRIAENTKLFEQVGTTPSAGQATENRIMRATESLLARSPGGAGPMVNKAETQAQEVGAAIEEKAKALAGKTSGETTGRHLIRSIRGEGGFVDQFKNRQTQLYDALDTYIPKGTRVDVSATRAALESLNADIPGAPNLSKFFQNARIKGIQRAFKADTEGMSSVAANPEFADLFEGRNISPEDAALFGDVLADGNLPYEAIKKLRTLVGDEIANSSLVSDVPRSKWKALYAAITQDLGKAVEGDPRALAAWKRATNYTRAGMRRIESIESVLDRNGGPEAVFQAAISGTKEGASTLRAVMQSTDEQGRRMITATVLRRLGKAKPGTQNEFGDKFSPETFLTNWNALSSEAKSSLFNRYSPGFRADMDRIAKFASNLREGSQVFRNPSGTAQAQTQAATIGAFVMSLMTGQLGAAGAIGGTVLGANRTAALMTNPKFVHWLARSTKVPMARYPAFVNTLAQQARDSGDLDLARIAVLLQQQAPQGNEPKTP